MHTLEIVAHAKPFASRCCIDPFLTHSIWLQPIGATPKERDETSVDVGLLAMPRELRNKIYEELLHLDEFQVQQFQPWRKIDPKILAVCRQIYQEASEILYDKNGWVTVTALDWIMSFMARDKIGVYTGFPGHDQPVTRYENDRLSKSAILDIK